MTGNGAPHIAMFVHTHDDRAVSRYVMGVSEQLVTSGVAVTLLHVAAAPRRTPAPPGVTIRAVARAATRTAMALPPLARELHRGKFDVVFAHLNGPGRAALLARILGRVRVAVIPVEHVHYSTFYRQRHKLQDPMTRVLYRTADRVAGVSEGVVDELERMFPSVRGRTIILPSTGPDQRRVAEAAQPPAHGWFAEPQRPIVISSVANVLSRKGQDVIVRALPAVRAAVGDVRLALVGRSDDKAFVARLRTLTRELGVEPYVWFAGYHDDALPFIRHSDALVLASTTDGAPMVLVEAMACGTPVVATDCPGGPRYTLSSGKFGQLVPVGDHDALAIAITAALTDNAWRVDAVQRGLRRADDFTPTAVARRYREVTDEVIGERPNPKLAI